MPIDYEGKVGRLVEIRFRPPITDEDIDGLSLASRLHAARVGRRLVSCVDALQLTVAPPSVADRMATMLRDRSPRIERTAVILPPQEAALALQIERLHRDAGNPARRTFRSPEAAMHFLEEVLDEPERARLRAFIAGIAPT